MSAWLDLEDCGKWGSEWWGSYLAALHSMWDLSFPTRDQTCAPCIASAVLTTGPPGKPRMGLLVSAGHPDRQCWDPVHTGHMRPWQHPRPSPLMEMAPRGRQRAPPAKKPRDAWHPGGAVAVIRLHLRPAVQARGPSRGPGRVASPVTPRCPCPPPSLPFLGDCGALATPSGSCRLSAGHLGCSRCPSLLDSSRSRGARNPPGPGPS